METILWLLGIFAALCAFLCWACCRMAALAEPPITKRHLDEHEEAIAGAAPFGN